MRSAIWDALHRTTVRMLGWIRLAQLMPGVVLISVGGAPHYANSLIAWAALTTAGLWSLFLFTRGVARPQSFARYSAIDVAVMATVSIVLGLQCVGTDVVSWENWAIGTSMGAAVLATIILSPVKAGIATAVLAISYLVGTAHAWSTPGVLPKAITNVGSLLAFVLVAAVFTALLRARSRELATLSAEVSQRRAQEAAAQASAVERERQYRLVHDTALATLTMIGQGRLSTDDSAVRQRCLADAQGLRDLVSGPLDRPSSSLITALRTQANDARALGLSVDLRTEGVNPDLEPDIVTAFSLALRESLNNVLKHAQSNHARVTAMVEPSGRVLIAVVDQGRGFDSVLKKAQRGLTQSVTARMREVGGDAKVTSEAGVGTHVELSWQPT